MQYSLDMLVHGKAEIVDYYRAAAARWQEIWAKKEARNMESLARVLPSEEPWSESNCGGPGIGQEVMVVSGLVALYSPNRGFGENRERARLLYDAFRISFCSIDVYVFADRVAQSYELLGASLV